MATMKKPDQQLVDQYLELVSTFDNIVQKKMFGCPCSFINGNMFLGVVEDRIFLRMGGELRNEVLTRYQGQYFAPRGRIMKEYLTIPPEIVDDRTALVDLVQRAYMDISALPPKTKKA
jgi:TfoX/Sxy family transcriptional regulator of competence genes